MLARALLDPWCISLHSTGDGAAHCRTMIDVSDDLIK